METLQQWHLKDKDVRFSPKFFADLKSMIKVRQPEKRNPGPPAKQMDVRPELKDYISTL